MATVEIFATSESGDVQSSNATYLTARSGSSLTLHLDNQYPRVGQTTGYTIWESFLEIDLASVPTDCTVVSAILGLASINGDSSTTNFVMKWRDLDYGATLTTADYVAGASIESSGTLRGQFDHATTSWMTNLFYNQMTDAAMTALVQANLGGIIRLIGYSDRHAAGTQPSGDEYQYYAGIGDALKPKLTISYIPAGGGAAFKQNLGTAAIEASSTTTVLSPSSKSVATGDLIAVAVYRYGATSTAHSAVDNLGNEYTFREQSSNGSSIDVIMLTAPVTFPGSITSITVTHDTATYRAITAAVYTGVGDFVEAAGGTTGVGITTGTWATSKSIPAKGIAIGFVGSNAANMNFVAGAASGSPSTTPYLDTSFPNTTGPLSSLYAVAGASDVATFTGTATLDGAVDSGGAGAIFEPAIAMVNVYPDADVADGGWTATPLWSKVEETSPDGTIITATSS